MTSVGKYGFSILNHNSQLYKQTNDRYDPASHTEDVSGL